MIFDYKMELEMEKTISRSRGLSVFRRNATTWELLLLLASLDGKSDLGVQNTLRSLQTDYLGQSAMLKFLRDRRADGLLQFDEHDKRSMRRIRLAPSLLAEIQTLLKARNRLLIENEHSPSDRQNVEKQSILLLRSAIRA